MQPYPRMSRWFGLIATTGLLMIACRKNTGTSPDPRDAYVGTWIEQVSNGVPVPDGSRRDTLDITKADANKLRVDKLIRAGAFTASLAGTGRGYQADNLPINTGTTIVFQNGTRSPVVLAKMEMLLSGSQLTMAVSYSAQAGSESVRQEYVEVLTKR